MKLRRYTLLKAMEAFKDGEKLQVAEKSVKSLQRWSFRLEIAAKNERSMCVCNYQQKKDPRPELVDNNSGNSVVCDANAPLLTLVFFPDRRHMRVLTTPLTVE